MRFRPNANGSHSAARRGRINSSIEILDNPVRRYLRNRSVGPGLWARMQQMARNRMSLTPALQ